MPHNYYFIHFLVLLPRPPIQKRLYFETIVTLDGKAIAVHSLHAPWTSPSQRRYLDLVQLRRQHLRLSVMLVTKIVFEWYYFIAAVSLQLLSDYALMINNCRIDHKLSRVIVCQKQG